jgi:hypothetical protein
VNTSGARAIVSCWALEGAGEEARAVVTTAAMFTASADHHRARVEHATSALLLPYHLWPGLYQICSLLLHGVSADWMLLVEQHADWMLLVLCCCRPSSM